MRKSKWFWVKDTETAGSLLNPLVYDDGFKITNRKGEVAERMSIVVRDIYEGQKEIMETAYYAKKLPKYEVKLASGERQMMSFYELRQLFIELSNKYDAREVYAYNINFDRRALNNTMRFVTDNKYRYFFPFGTKFHCIWNMACQVLLARPSYIKFALENGYLSEKGNILTNAECCYRYITKNTDFVEEHEGIDDVEIETEILLKCLRQHKKMNTKPNQACWRMVQKKRKEMGL